MEAALLSFLMWMNRVQGIHDVPAEVPAGWVGAREWQQSPKGLVIEASSKSIVEECKKFPQGYIKFPVVLYGAHEVWLDGKKSQHFGDPTMQTPNYVVSAPVIKCETLEAATELQWRATAYSRYYAHFDSYPEFSKTAPPTRLFGETLYIGSAIGLIVLALFSLSVLYGKESNPLMLSLTSAMILNGIYMLMLILPAFQISLPMVSAHRIGDTSLGLGFAAVMYCFWIEKLIPRAMIAVHLFLTALAAPFWLLGTSGDTIQFGTSLPMLSVLSGLAFVCFRLLNSLRKTKSLEAAFTFLFSAIFLFACVNDIFVFTGSGAGLTFMSVGLLSAFLIFLLGVNQRISATYRERDYLRENLEHEVERKTAQLKQKTQELELAMTDLRHTQAELIQSAKLASLGTLSAGIAHEINNSINFVNGAIVPLERIVMKLQAISARDFEMGQKLLKAVKDGVTLTVEIVKSLRQFTGLNQAKLKDMHLSEVISSVETILSSKLKGKYQVRVDFDDQLTLFGDVVGINQILMNLMTNAVDAMPDGGTISVRAYKTDVDTVIEVGDSGTGIPENIRNRIFDPFFTTKEVGQGTGLGLFIISNEVKKHGGRIELVEVAGEGATFRLTFPFAIPGKEVAA